ncbi:hypothetical protein GBAR_LOCUS125 [Geodia barretti]|uniref:Uncharacterized protein n=1 Tax=Geodia barretti TaxID=519541 RepID=A0AA35VZU9_GEOBA|nr:hypothetical protein GBAR_LOCUS125 [Geodia barretti]
MKLRLEKKSQSEEEWVEAEIGRLLHHAEVDDEDEARSSPTSELQAVDERWKGDSCVGHVFSAYLSSLECRQSDEQDLISDAFSALNMATGSLAKRPDNSVKEVITDLTLTLSRLEQKESNTLDSVTIETYQIEEKGNTEGEAQLKKKTDSTTVEGVNLKRTVNSAYNEERRADFTSNQQREAVAVVEASPILEGSNSSAEGISKTTTVGDSSDNNDSSRYDQDGSSESGDLCDLELGPDELSDEVLAVFEQVRNDQRTCEEQLSTEQKQREAELTMEIEEAQRMIAEYQEAEVRFNVFDTLVRGVLLYPEVLGFMSA